MSYDRWDEYLVAEHEMIERAMGVLKKGLQKLGHGAADSAGLLPAVDFLLEFGDRLHNVKEEKVLFPLMEKRGIPRGGPIGVMLMEHEAERGLLEKMLTAIPKLGNLSSDEVRQLAKDGLEYLSIRANHIWKENDVLYAMGRQVLTDRDNEYVMGEFQRLNSEIYGPDADTHFAEVLETVERGETKEKRLIENLTHAQLDAIMEALPFEVTFVDAKDEVAYFNRLDKDKIFPRTRSVIGRTVDKCHPSHSVDQVLQIVDGFKTNTLDKAEFWIDLKGDKVLIRYFPVRSESGEYMGVVEVTQSIGPIQALEGQKRLLDE